MRTAALSKEETDQEIKRYLFVYGAHPGSYGGSSSMIDQLTCCRQKLFRWYGSVEGMVLAGLQAAQTDLTAHLREFRAELARHPKLVTGAPDARGKSKVFAASTAAEVFGEYCRLVNDPQVCGGIVLRAAAEFPSPDSKIQQFAASAVAQHVAFLRNLLQQEKIDQPSIRARMLIAAASGLFMLPHGTVREEARFLPLFFHAITDAAISRTAGVGVD